MTTIEMALTLGSGRSCVAAAVLGAARRDARLRPAGRSRCCSRFAALTALSVVWSVQPDDELAATPGGCSPTAACSAAAVALARVVPQALAGACSAASRWPPSWSAATRSLTKVFPDHFDASEPSTRACSEPYGYWNAIGLTAAMGAIGCMWLGARRRRARAAQRAGLSRDGAAAADADAGLLARRAGRAACSGSCCGSASCRCACAARRCCSRRRSARAAVAAWDFSNARAQLRKRARSPQRAARRPRARRAACSRCCCCSRSSGVGGRRSRPAAARPRRCMRRRAGHRCCWRCLAACSCSPSLGALAASHRGFTGTISHAFHSLTDPHAKPSPNTPGRLTAVAQRARALLERGAEGLLGAPRARRRRGRLRSRRACATARGRCAVKHAHGFVVQTLADLGIVGLAAGARAARDLDGGGRALDAPVQPPLASGWPEAARGPAPRLGGARARQAGAATRPSGSAC